jgi:hypothetical protein
MILLRLKVAHLDEVCPYPFPEGAVVFGGVGTDKS